MNSAVIPLRQSAHESTLKQAAFDELPLPAICLNGSAQILAVNAQLTAQLASRWGVVPADPGPALPSDPATVTAPTLVGRHLSEALGYHRNRDFARRWAIFWSRLQDAGWLELRTQLRLAGGRALTVALSATRLRTDADPVAVVVLRDLGPERLRRRRGRDELALNAALLARGGDAVLLLDRDRRILGAKGPAERYFGVGRVVPGVVFEALLEADSARDFVAASRRAMAGRPGSGELRWIPVRGDEHPGRWLSVSLDNRLADTAVRAIVCVVRDATEVQDLRHQADLMRRRLQAFAEHGADLVAVVDPRGTAQYLSRSARAFLGAATAEGTVALSTVLDPVDRPVLARLLQAALADPDPAIPHRALVHAEGADGARVPLWLTLRNLTRVEGVGGVLATGVDVGAVPTVDGAPDERQSRRLALRERLLDLAIQSRLDFAQALATVLRACGEALQAGSAAFWRTVHEPAGLRCEACFDAEAGRFVRDWAGVQVRRDAAPTLFARIEDRQPLVVADFRTEPAVAALVADPRWRDVGAALLAPVVLEGEVRGVLSVHQKRAFAWDDDDVGFAASAAVLVALAMEGAQRQEAENRLEQLAWYDPLTGLPNRNLLRENLRDLIMTAGTRRRRIAVLLIDLDRFKDVNDTLGHLVGDALIKSAGRVLKETAGDAGLVARLGGDEFVVAVREFVHRQEVALLAARLVQALHRTDLVAQVDTQVSASIGIALFPEHGREISTLLKNADAAMYQAKRDGRNQFSFFNPIRAERAAREVQLGIQLLKALQAEASQFMVEYQPQVEMGSGRVIGLEALIRWRHPTLGLLTPDHFIGVAEVSGLSDRVTRWIVDEVCGQIRSWRSAWPGFDIPVSINVAGRELGSATLPALVRQTLARHEIPARLLVLEITERTLVSEGEVNNDVMGELARLGVGLSLDDFGTGYSTLGYLKRLPIHSLKIDQSFVEGIPGDNDSCAIVLAIIAVARHFRLKVIAEGIESIQQVDYLRSIGCTYAQGYYFSRALPAATILEYLESTVAPRPAGAP